MNQIEFTLNNRQYVIWQGDPLGNITIGGKVSGANGRLMPGLLDAAFNALVHSKFPCDPNALYRIRATTETSITIPFDPHVAARICVEDFEDFFMKNVASCGIAREIKHEVDQIHRRLTLADRFVVLSNSYKMLIQMDVDKLTEQMTNLVKQAWDAYEHQYRAYVTDRSFTYFVKHHLLANNFSMFVKPEPEDKEWLLNILDTIRSAVVVL